MSLGTSEQRERDMRIKALFVSGVTITAIGAEFGITRQRVQQILKVRFGLGRADGGESVTRKRPRRPSGPQPIRLARP